MGVSESITTPSDKAVAVTQALGIDILPGFASLLHARGLRRVETEHGATWSRVMMLGAFTEALPLAMPKLGVMMLTGWGSIEERIAYRDSSHYRALADHSRIGSLDLGAGVARSQHRDLFLEDDGWLKRLPAGKAPRGLVGVLTYARITPRGVWPFQRISREVTISARKADGFIGSVFATEFLAPVLRVMTLTLWDQRANASEWAYNGSVHPKAISWLFDSPQLMPGGCVARFPIVAGSGMLNGVDLATTVQSAHERMKERNAQPR
ncbi:MAG TPA: hypothetical protein VHV31_15275 [Nitrolancea sp.]|nr:hypothetical protein [Nitrolancea sp.]